jgi:hypothetical protein
MYKCMAQAAQQFNVFELLLPETVVGLVVAVQAFAIF